MPSSRLYAYGIVGKVRWAHLSTSHYIKPELSGEGSGLMWWRVMRSSHLVVPNKAVCDYVKRQNQPRQWTIKERVRDGLFSHSCFWLSQRDVWWDQTISQSLLYAPLLSLILPFPNNLTASLVRRDGLISAFVTTSGHLLKALAWCEGLYWDELISPPNDAVCI